MNDPEFSEVIIERFARAWASIDGKSEIFDREKLAIDGQWDTGTFEGYMVEALELLRRAGCKVTTS